MEDTLLKQLGPYAIEGIVGRGGMGSVFAARNATTGERAALKVLAPALAADQVFRDRFIAEIESLKKLHHPHIVVLYGYGEFDGHLFYAMELIEGSNLEQELQQGRRFSWREVIQIGIDVAKALKHAHDHGVVHRDLKPANLLLDQSGTVKLTDFGIAKLFGATRVTSNGNVLGTADYMAPEQAAGESTTPRSDLFSLGCVMFALLTGRPPFTGKTIAEVVHNLRYQDPPSVTKWNTDVPLELQGVISDLLHKNPAQRIRTAQSLIHRLRSVQEKLAWGVASERFDVGTPHEPAEGEVPLDISERPTVSLPEFSSDGVSLLPIQEGADSKSPPRDHFTRVKSERWPTESKTELMSAIPLMVLLFLAMGGIGMGIWYSMQPPTGDMLYERISSYRDSTDPATLLQAEGDIQRFLAESKEDPRRGEIESLNDEIVLYRLQRQLELLALRRRSIGTPSQIEQTYIEAVRLKETDIEGAISKIRGLIDLHRVEPNAPKRAQQIVEVAERKLLPKWEQELRDISLQGREMLEEKIGQAARLEATDVEKARAIYRGIETIYADRQWASEFVRLAREKLKAQSVAGTP